MNLDDLTLYPIIDHDGMINDITSLPQQLSNGWKSGLATAQTFQRQDAIQNVVIAGMGGSAIAGDLVAATIQQEALVPVQVVREYSTPAWVNPKHTLLIASSHSGNTEETLSIVYEAHSKGIPIICITRGGKLQKFCDTNGIPCLIFKHDGQPRSAVGISFASMLAILFTQGLISDPSEAIQNAVEAMISQQKIIGVDSPIHQNPAKRLAGQMVGRNLTLFGSGILVPIARRWKGQINELAKTWCLYDTIPEACHNTISGSQFPEDPICTNFAFFLKSASDHPRNKKRIDLLQNILMVQGFVTDSLTIRGKTDMEILWNALSFGDFTAYYLAIANGVDPSPVPVIEGFKKDLGEFSPN